MLCYYVRIWFKKFFLVSVMNAINESILTLKTKWENFCDNSPLHYYIYCCFFIGVFNGLVIQSIYNGFFNGLYYTFTWPYNGVVYGKLPNNLFWLNCFSSMIEALFFVKLFFITRYREYYRRIISKYNEKNYAKDENVSK